MCAGIVRGHPCKFLPIVPHIEIVNKHNSVHKIVVGFHLTLFTFCMWIRESFCKYMRERVCVCSGFPVVFIDCHHEYRIFGHFFLCSFHFRPSIVWMFFYWTWENAYSKSHVKTVVAQVLYCIIMCVCGKLNFSFTHSITITRMRWNYMNSPNKLSSFLPGDVLFIYFFIIITLFGLRDFCAHLVSL